MPSSVADIFVATGLAPAGHVRWGQRLPEAGPGVYAVALTGRTDAVAGAMSRCPVSEDAVAELLAVRPELRVDGGRPTQAELSARLAALWLADESIVYIGLAGTSLRHRVGQYYKTPLGACRPHAGGWPLKTLSVLPQLWVHFAPCPDPTAAETAMLSAFRAGVSASARAAVHDSDLPIPFANLEAAKGQRQRHGITGAREPAIRS